jgi:glycosyltransferase involved in cell wall biosynthesis
MRIGLNGSCFNARASGATQRFKGIYGELFALRSNDEFVVFEPSDSRLREWFPSFKNVRFVETPLSSTDRIQRFLQGALYWPGALSKQRFDFFEGFNLPMVRPAGIPCALTIHDIGELAEERSIFSKFLYRNILSQSIGNATEIIAVSQFTKREILELFPSANVSVVYNGISPELFKKISGNEIRDAKSKFNLPDDFILTVGHFEKRKNFPNLVRAVARAGACYEPQHLVMIGNDSGQMEGVKHLSRELGIENRIHIHTGLSDFEVRCIYKAAKLFVFPSLYEGFGIPLIEAMAASTPVIVSDIPVFLEITQGQIPSFAPDRPDAIADCFNLVLSSEAQLAKIVEFGNARARDFTFESVAKNLSDIYDGLTLEASRR